MSAYMCTIKEVLLYVYEYNDCTGSEYARAEGSLFEWAWFIFNKYSTLFLKATWVTLYVALIGTLLGFILGFAVGIINTVKIHKEDNIVKKILLHILKAIVVVYVEIFRDTPMIVQGMVIYYGLRQNDIMITSIIAGILVTTLNTGAYMGETVRAGIKSVDAGQGGRRSCHGYVTF